jgi:membrane-bound metal-dependent hydrolase YbcI (DUF457 family)
LTLRRVDPRLTAPVLAGAVIFLDLCWSLLVGSTGPLAYGLIDEPCHLATCVVALLAAMAIAGLRPGRPFVVAALVSSVAIDIDHIPRYLGSQALSGTLPRPYTHSLLLVAALMAVAAAARRPESREVWLGAAFGVATHLFRDIATGPGIPLFWPASDKVVSAPYAVFAVSLVLAAGAVVGLGSLRRRLKPLAALIGAIAAMTLILAAPAHAAGRRTISLGAYIPGAVTNPSLINAYANEVGQKPVIVSTYVQWMQPVLRRTELQPIWAHGAVALVTWEPWTSSEHGFPLRSIVKGRYDGYIRKAARAAAAWRKPVFLRFAHEMNGDWYPWGTGHGNTPQLYKRAWRHVVRLFRQVGATNVRWVWSPYVTNGGRFGFAKYFPGNRWIDWVGLDGFNWAKNGVWQSFRDIFATSYGIVKKLTNRPIMIPETGSSQTGGNKAAWVTRTLDRELPHFARIRALLWFCEPFRGIDTRVDSSPAALAALRRAIRNRRYRSSRRRLLATPSLLRY